MLFLKKIKFIIVLVFSFWGIQKINAQEPIYFHQIFLQDTIIDLKKVNYSNDTIGKRLGFKLSEDRTIIQLLNYDGVSKVEIEYVGKLKGLTQEYRYKCNIHTLPIL